jgi:hypothetical protein
LRGGDWWGVCVLKRQMPKKGRGADHFIHPHQIPAKRSARGKQGSRDARSSLRPISMANHK